MSEIAYVVFSRVAYEFETRVRFRIRFMYVRSGSCQSPKPWPNVQDTDDTVPSEKYALVLG
jgi:hypothetical protein